MIVHLRDVAFTSPKKGWVVGWGKGKGIILNTEDGGISFSLWGKMPGVSLHIIDFINRKEGWILGTENVASGNTLLLHTEDGGISWNMQGKIEEVIYGMYFVNSILGYAAGRTIKGPPFHGVILRTSDAGKSWTVLQKTDDILYNLHFVNAKEGWVVGRNGTILHTEDGGENFFPQESGTSESLSGVYFINEEEGWITGGGIILHTTDSGKIWNIQWKTDKNTWIAEDGRILHSTDDGKTWNIQRKRQNIENIQQYKNLRRIYFVNRNKGWAIGEGIILHTEDGGETWQEQKIGLECSERVSLRGMSFINPEEGGIAAEDMGILVTSDGGKTWEVKAKEWAIKNPCAKPKPQRSRSFPLQKPKSVFFSDALHGWIVGNTPNKSVVYHTKDGGKTWEEQDIGLPKLAGVWLRTYFVDSQTGWIAGVELGQGDRLVMVHTSDGGKTWEKLDLPKDAQKGRLIAMRFLDRNTGYILSTGNVSSILKYWTEDSGKNWRKLRMPVNINVGMLFDVYFLDTQHGWACGESGILRTENGGRNWKKVNNSSGYWIYFVDNLHGWLATLPMGGYAVMKTEDGGTSWKKVLQINQEGKIASIPSVAVVNNEQIFVITKNYDTIKYTLDGGETWEIISLGEAWLEDSCYDGKDTIWIVGRWGDVLKYTDSRLHPIRRNQAVEANGKLKTRWGVVKRSGLYQNFPNPFNPSTWLPYQLAKDTPVVIRIYDSRGNLVRTLDLGKKKAGVYRSAERAAHWDGCNQAGERMASGLYFYTLKAGYFQATRRMLLLK